MVLHSFGEIDAQNSESVFLSSSLAPFFYSPALPVSAVCLLVCLFIFVWRFGNDVVVPSLSIQRTSSCAIVRFYWRFQFQVLNVCLSVCVCVCERARMQVNYMRWKVKLYHRIHLLVCSLCYLIFEHSEELCAWRLELTLASRWQMAIREHNVIATLELSLCDRLFEQKIPIYICKMNAFEVPTWCAKGDSVDRFILTKNALVLFWIVWDFFCFFYVSISSFTANKKQQTLWAMTKLHRISPF